MKNIVLYINEQNNTTGLLTVAPEYISKIEDVVKKDISGKVLYKVISSDELPKNIEFTGAWKVKKDNDDIKVVVDIDAAKEIWKEKWRVARKPILEQLDIEYIRASEQNDTQKVQEIILKKEQLRNITNTPLSDSLDVITDTWPEILGPKLSN